MRFAPTYRQRRWAMKTSACYQVFVIIGVARNGKHLLERAKIYPFELGQ